MFLVGICYSAHAPTSFQIVQPLYEISHNFGRSGILFGQSWQNFQIKIGSHCSSAVKNGLLTRSTTFTLAFYYGIKKGKSTEIQSIPSFQHLNVNDFFFSKSLCAVASPNLISFVNVVHLAKTSKPIFAFICKQLSSSRSSFFVIYCPSFNLSCTEIYLNKQAHPTSYKCPI